MRNRGWLVLITSIITPPVLCFFSRFPLHGLGPDVMRWFTPDFTVYGPEESKTIGGFTECQNPRAEVVSFPRSIDGPLKHRAFAYPVVSHPFVEVFPNLNQLITINVGSKQEPRTMQIPTWIEFRNRDHTVGFTLWDIDQNRMVGDCVEKGDLLFAVRRILNTRFKPRLDCYGASRSSIYIPKIRPGGIYKTLSPFILDIYPLQSLYHWSQVPDYERKLASYVQNNFLAPLRTPNMAWMHTKGVNDPSHPNYRVPRERRTGPSQFSGEPHETPPDVNCPPGSALAPVDHLPFIVEPGPERVIVHPHAIYHCITPAELVRVADALPPASPLRTEPGAGQPHQERENARSPSRSGRRDSRDYGHDERDRESSSRYNYHDRPKSRARSIGRDPSRYRPERHESRGRQSSARYDYHDRPKSRAQSIGKDPSRSRRRGRSRSRNGRRRAEY